MRFTPGSAFGRPRSLPTKIKIVCALLALALLQTRASSAAQVSLSNAFLSDLLAPNAYAVVGTERFDNFTFMSTSSGGALQPNPSIIKVTGYTNGTAGGLVFQNGPFLAVNNQTMDGRLAFNVTELDPMKRITNAELNFTGATSGGGMNSILEVVRDSLNNQLGQGLVIQRQDFPNGGTSSNTIAFAPQTTIQISKDISLLGTAFTGTGANVAQISDFTQAFDQTAVPEPSSIAMSAMGSGGLLWFGWRKRKRLKRAALPSQQQPALAVA